MTDIREEEFKKYKYPFSNKDLNMIQGDACPHLKHAMMASEGMSRVCESCTIERLEYKISKLENELNNQNLANDFIQDKNKDLDSKIAALKKELKVKDFLVHGVTFSKDGKRIPPKDVFQTTRELELESKLEFAVETLKIIELDLKITGECRKIASEMLPNALHDIDGIRLFAKKAIKKIEGVE